MSSLQPQERIERYPMKSETERAVLHIIYGASPISRIPTAVTTYVEKTHVAVEQWSPVGTTVIHHRSVKHAHERIQGLVDGLES